MDVFSVLLSTEVLLRSAERIHNMSHVPGSLQLGYHLASRQCSRHYCAIGFFSQHPCYSTREQFKSIWRLQKTKHQMSNETLKTSNKRRLSRDEAKSYISIFLLLYIYRCSAFCFHCYTTRGCSSSESKENVHHKRQIWIYRNQNPSFPISPSQ